MDHVRSIFKSHDELTKKKVRRLLEQRMGLAEGELDSRKNEVNECVDQITAEEEDSADVFDSDASIR